MKSHPISVKAKFNIGNMKTSICKYASSFKGAFNILLIASKQPAAANSVSPSSSESSPC